MHKTALSKFLCILLSLAVTIQGPLAMASTASPPNYTLQGLSGPDGEKVYRSYSKSEGKERVYYTNKDGLKQWGTLEADRTILWEKTPQRPVGEEVRPEQLEKKFGWKKSSEKAVGNLLNRYRLYRSDRKAKSAQDTLTTEETVKQANSLNLAKTSTAFYLALGLAAVINLAIFYPQDPVAWDNYLNNLTDPVGYASLAGYIVAAGYVIKLLPSRTFKGQIGTLGLAMLAGSLVSTVIYEFATDPDTRSCLYFNSAGLVMSGPRDMGACSRAYDNWFRNPGNLSNALLPSLARMSAAVPTWLGLSYGSKFIIDALHAGLRIPKIPVGGFATTAFQILLFLAADQITEAVVGTEYHVKKWQVASFSFHGDEVGTTIAKIQDNLFYEWAQLKKSEWKSDSTRMRRVLERHHELQNKWRAIIFQETSNSFTNWMQKVRDYNSMVEFSHGVYHDIITTLKDRHLTIQQQINIQRNQNPNHSPQLSYSLAQNWTGLKSANPLDFVLLSMSCGPDAAKTPSTLESWGAWIGISVDVMNEDPVGSATRFRPPKLTGLDEDVCGQYPFGLRTPTGRSPIPQYTVDQIVVKDKNNTRFHGLASYLATHIRPEVLNDFEGWWDKAVQPQTDAIRKEFTEQYNTMLIQKMFPAVTNKAYRWGWCEPNRYAPEAKLSSILNSLRETATDCPVEATGRLANGLLNSYLDDLRIYATLYLDLLTSNPKAIHYSGNLTQEEYDTRFLAAAREILNLTQESARYSTSLEINRDYAAEMTLRMRLLIPTLDASLADPLNPQVFAEDVKETKPMQLPLLAETLLRNMSKTLGQVNDLMYILDVNQVPDANPLTSSHN